MVIGLGAAVVGWCWHNRGAFMGYWAMSHAND
ncbi:hypothetical protein SRB5_43880 [Streptomyces sp. RB5]|uniref:Uncharacterized protein n=1 Tax=Streptomyces smaragdinus TaxID=2585196 RepID=A0A7K0CL62_9ACTN|nr:hypothetical protein [Streptomyces smaragdinus]